MNTMNKFQRDMLAFEPAAKIDKTKNQVNVLFPTRNKYGVWSFDDADLGIVGEPFVGQINNMIDIMVPGKEACLIYCSKDPIPDYNISLTKREDVGQGMYQMDGTDIVGWLCPCFLNYFPDYVEKVYAKIEELGEHLTKEL